MAEQTTIEKLAGYVATALSRPLPPEVTEKTKHHLLDTVAAMVTGAHLKPGELAIAFARSQGSVAESTIAGSDVVTTAIMAAMANGMLAHSDETDDSHAPSLTHPGCAIVPAALAVAEREDADGDALLRSIALGYDVSSRIARAMGGISARGMHGHATHAIGPMFGATATASALAGLDPRGVRYALAFTAQQASGITSWQRDSEHVEKSFVFGGMGARNGVTSALFVQSGMTGEEDTFSGDWNFLDLFCPERDKLDGWVDQLGSDYEILITNIKKYAVGSPIQAAAEAMMTLVSQYRLQPQAVREIEVLLPPQGSRIVNARAMPDVNLQYCMAVILLDGGVLTFESTHTYERLSAPDVRDLMARVRLEPNPKFAGMERQRPATVRLHLHDGQTLELHVPTVHGTADEPMTRDEVSAKALDLLGGVFGPSRAQAIVDTAWGMGAGASTRDFASLLRS